MVGYAALSLLSPGQPLDSRVGLGLVGICIVALAVCSAFGLAGFLGIAFNPTSTQVLPFLALGLGVDDMFVLAHHFKASEAGPSITLMQGGAAVYAEALVRDCLAKAGPSITLTSTVRSDRHFPTPHSFLHNKLKSRCVAGELPRLFRRVADSDSSGTSSVSYIYIYGYMDIWIYIYDV